MTVNEQDVKKANLEFFEANFFNAESISFKADVSPRARTVITRAIGLVESTLWLRLGIDLDFFDADSVVKKLLSIEDVLGTAWSVLTGVTQITTDTWCNFMTLGPYGRSRFMSEEYLHAYLPESEILELSKNLELSQQVFLSQLLLTSEVIFEPSTMLFLENIRWSSDAKWESQLEGSEESSVVPEVLYTGFANHVRYIEEFWRFSTQLVQEHMALRPLISQILHIIGKRIIIDQQIAKQRCFEFGGDVVAMLRAPGPEWLQTRATIFETLNLVTAAADSRENQRERVRLWPIFVAHSNGEQRTVPVERFEKVQQGEVQQGEVAEPASYEQGVGRVRPVVLYREIEQKSTEPASIEADADEDESSKKETS